MDKRLKECNWAGVNNMHDVNEAVSTLTNVIGNMFNDCFPLVKVRVSSKDPPFMTPLVKHLFKKGNRQIQRGIKNSPPFDCIDEVLMQTKAIIYHNLKTNAITVLRMLIIAFCSSPYDKE